MTFLWWQLSWTWQGLSINGLKLVSERKGLSTTTPHTHLLRENTHRKGLTFIPLNTKMFLPLFSPVSQLCWSHCSCERSLHSCPSHSYSFTFINATNLNFGFIVKTRKDDWEKREYECMVVCIIIFNTCCFLSTFLFLAFLLYKWKSGVNWKTHHVCGFYLEPLVLQDLLDGHQLSRVAELSLVDDAKRAVANDLCVRVAHLLWPVRALAWSGHNCCYLAAIFIP